MPRRHALPVSLYVTGRIAVVIGDDASAQRRARQLTDAGATVRRARWQDYDASVCEGAWLVALQHEGDPPPGAIDAARIAADARAAGCVTYVADRPELSDFAMPGIAARGPLKLAVSSDAVAPALTRRLREQLQALLDASGEHLDALIDALERRRAELPRGQRAAALYRMASRLRLVGRIEIDG